MKTADLDKLIAEITGFASYADMAHSMEAHGYLPTFTDPGRPGLREKVDALAAEILARGHKIFRGGQVIG